MFYAVGDKLDVEFDEKKCRRLGGDKFVVVLPETNLEDAPKFAEIIRKSIELAIVFDG